MCLLELWFSQGICPVVGLLSHVVERNVKKEREIERGRRESVERKDEEKKRGSIVVERELSGLLGFINVMEICIPG